MGAKNDKKSKATNSKSKKCKQKTEKLSDAINILLF